MNSDLQVYNQITQESIDQDARKEILKSKPSKDSIRLWRKSCHLSRRELGELMGYSMRHIQRIETGEYRINEKFLYNLRQVVKRIDRGLKRIPTSARRYPRSIKNIAQYVNVNSLSGGEFRLCPNCREDKWFSSRQKTCCSKRCTDAYGRKVKKGLIKDERVRLKNYSRALQVKCPHCQEIIPVKGNLVGDSDHILFEGRSESDSDGQAPDDAAGQVGASPGR